MLGERHLDELGQRSGMVDRGVLGTPDQRRREVDVELLLVGTPLAGICLWLARSHETDASKLAGTMNDESPPPPMAGTQLLRIT